MELSTTNPFDLPSFRFRDIHPKISIGTASDRYAGWIGQIYTKERYHGRIVRRTHMVGGKSFIEGMLYHEMVENTASLMKTGINEGVHMNIIINNRAGGNAPLIAQRITKQFIMTYGITVETKGDQRYRLKNSHFHLFTYLSYNFISARIFTNFSSFFSRNLAEISLSLRASLVLPSM